MGADVYISEDQAMENTSDNRLASGEMTLLPCRSGSKSGKLHYAKADELSSEESGAYGALRPETVSEVSLSSSIMF